MNILQIRNNNYFANRDGYTPRFIIPHGTAGFTSATDVAYFFQKAQVSSHYVIGQDETVVQCVDEHDGAWGNGVISGIPTANLPFREFGDGIHRDDWWSTSINPNNLTISVEHVKPHTDNSDILTPAQRQASFELIAAICDRWNIPRRFADRNGGITGHFSMDPANRSRCPGPYPWQELFAYLNNGEDTMLQITDPFAAAYFVEKATDRWGCPSKGLDIFGGILAYYRAINGACRLPLTGEQYNIPGVAWQAFECGIIVYDPQKKLDAPKGAGDCYLAKFDSDIAKSVLSTISLHIVDIAGINVHLKAIQDILSKS